MLFFLRHGVYKKQNAATLLIDGKYTQNLALVNVAWKLEIFDLALLRV